MLTAPKIKTPTKFYIWNETMIHSADRQRWSQQKLTFGDVLFEFWIHWENLNTESNRYVPWALYSFCVHRVFNSSKYDYQLSNGTPWSWSERRRAVAKEQCIYFRWNLHTKEYRYCNSFLMRWKMVIYLCTCSNTAKELGCNNRIGHFESFGQTEPFKRVRNETATPFLALKSKRRTL